MVQDVIRYLIRESARGEAQADPWTAATYAAGKVSAGVILVALWHFAIVAVTGVVAGKVWVALVPFLAAYAWEARQGWRGKDTLADLVFWKLGIFCTVFVHAETGPGQVSPQAVPLFWSLGLIGAALFVLVAAKLRAQRDAK